MQIPDDSNARTMIIEREELTLRTFVKEHAGAIVRAVVFCVTLGVVALIIKL